MVDLWRNWRLQLNTMAINSLKISAIDPLADIFPYFMLRYFLRKIKALGIVRCEGSQIHFTGCKSGAYLEGSFGVTYLNVIEL
jgi:hypothetical protein